MPVVPRRCCHEMKSRVEARWPPSTSGFSPNWEMASGADRTWYGATVTGVGADMTYSLRYDDGGQATGVGADHVRAPPAQKRPRACVPFCHPGTEKAAFGISPPDGFLVTLGDAEAAPAAGKRKWHGAFEGPELVTTLKVPAWTLADGDQRYVVEHLGRTVEFSNGVAQRERPAESLRCWAEYSGPAQVVENRGKPGPRYHCEPTRASKIFMDPQAWGLHITDVDPSIFFGFNYTLCKQHSCVKMATLDSGSIILFGSVGGEEGWQKEPRRGKFYLDTVFVTGASAEVSTGKRDKVDDDGNCFSKVIISAAEWSEFVGEGRIRAALEDKDVPAETRAAWRSLFDGPSGPGRQIVAAAGSHPGASELPSGRWPTKTSHGPEVRRVYKGVGFKERSEYDGMFSFVPAWRADASPALRQRPTLDLDKLSERGMPWPHSGKRWPAALNGQLTGAVAPELSPAKMKEVWDEVVTQVRAQNFEIGSWFSPPPPMPAAIASALEGGVELGAGVTIAMAESDVGALQKGQRLVDALWQEDPEAVWTIDRVLSGPALRLRGEARRGEPMRVISLVDRAQREALTPAA